MHVELLFCPVIELYFPAAHALHAELPDPLAYVPVGHVVQLLLRFAPANAPGEHSAHSVAPGVSAGKENVPSPHESQTLGLPSAVENVPSAHDSQSTSVVFEQALHPVYRLYLPAPHRMHGPPAGPHRPATQLQLSRSNDRGGENVPSEHVASSPE